MPDDLRSRLEGVYVCHTHCCDLGARNPPWGRGWKYSFTDEACNSKTQTAGWETGLAFPSPGIRSKDNLSTDLVTFSMKGIGTCNSWLRLSLTRSISWSLLMGNEQAVDDPKSRFLGPSYIWNTDWKKKKWFKFFYSWRIFISLFFLYLFLAYSKTHSVGFISSKTLIGLVSVSEIFRNIALGFS